MRSPSGWSDACILNISSTGLMVYSDGAAEPGHTVELRRGGQLVIARVVWRRNQRMGLASHDPVPVEDIISSETADAARTTAEGFHVERRRQPRDPEKSRQTGRAFEFLSLAVAGTLLAGAAGAFVYDALVRPAHAVQAALQRH